MESASLEVASAHPGRKSLQEAATPLTVGTLHGATTRNTAVFILAAVRASHMTINALFLIHYLLTNLLTGLGGFDEDL
jgi:hypothetical protein